MAEKDWRTSKEKGSMRKKDDWRSQGSSEKNRHFSTSGLANKHYKPSKKPVNPSTNFSANSRVNSNQNLKVPENDIVLNNLVNQQFLNNLVENGSTEDITAFLISNMDVYTQTLASDISEKLIITFINLGAKACNNSFVTSKTYMLKSTLRKKFVGTICSFLSGLLMKENKDPEYWQNFRNVLNSLLVILENAMQFIPITLWEHIQSILKTVTLVLPVIVKDKKIILAGDFEVRIAALKESVLKIERKFKKSEPIPKENGESTKIEEYDPEDDYRFIDLYPSSEELTIPERPYLRNNIIKGRYSSLQQYLDIHFRLMREDFLNPIREDVCDYLNNAKRRFFNIKVHKNVVFVKKEALKNTICFEIAFEVSQALKNMIQTKQNKRLMHGTLLFFSSDNFKTIFCGKVMSNDEIRDGRLLINLPNSNQIDYTKKYSMIECVIFFEPYYQVLKVLQRLSQDHLPMEKYILGLETTISYPKYMENVRNLKLPLGLNPSQTEAINAALNKEFVIIQGPPGTGKTFLGMTLVRTLLYEREFWRESGPILVICYTNHALEQFLEGLSDYTDKLVRLGRNSKDLRLAESKYGPEVQLRNFFEQYYIYEEEYEDDVYYDDYGNFTNKLDKDFRGLLNHLKFGHGGRHGYKIGEIQKYLPLVSSRIKEWLRQKGHLAKTSQSIKYEETIMTNVKLKIDSVLYNEKGLIQTEFIKENNVDYCFQNIELFCWLLCDDGSICPKDSKEMDTCRENYAAEEETIYNLLSNFVLEINGDSNCSTLSVSRLKDAAYELESYLKSNKDLADRQYLNDQLKLLLGKADFLKYCLETDFGPPEVEFNGFPNPFMIQSKHRWQFYKQWLEVYKNQLRQSLDQHCHTIQRLNDYYSDLREMDNVRLLREMDIVGMTTTCAARLRSTLEVLKSPIVIVEEAAEVLESHIVAALTKDCQHLVLLGDHQQLRPATSDYTIEKKYKLGISLFERMVQNNVECHTLNVQHRMRPEISSLISPLFYKDLLNHESVETYPMVSGLDPPLYFIDHMEPEELYGDSSKMNMHEAKFLIQLAIYLLNNGHEPKDITILAAYRGQSYVLKKEQDKSLHPLVREVRIAVVDNFQGEENKIILLSLVRNNSENKVGFLSIDNRVCVALSRAKIGLYIMGNMRQLCKATDIWKSIKASLESQKAIGRYLPLRCKNHKEHITLVSKPIDFLKVPEGGCTQACKALLKCGHTCVKICHGYDVNHELYDCKEPCTRLLCDNKNHNCKKLCYDNCGHCQYPVTRQLPCGHETILACFTSIEKYECMETTKVQLNCEHWKNVPCYLNAKARRQQPETKTVSKEIPNTELNLIKCTVEMEKLMPECKHIQVIPCYKQETFKCEFEIEILLKCGHKNKKPCYLDENQVTCLVPCESKLRCGHTCELKCHPSLNRAHLLYKCTKPCSKNLAGCNNPETHPKCQLLCYERCSSCKEKVIKSYSRCRHIKKMECYKATPLIQCYRPCNKKLPCGHLCQKKCSELCGSCQHNMYKNVPECGHKIQVKCTETPLQENCKNRCTKILDCGHNCARQCNEECNNICTEPCKKVLDCGHKCINRCHESCACKIEIIPKCGHSVAVKCGDEPKCEEPCWKRLNCGHLYLVHCNKPTSDVICEKNSLRTLNCGHTQSDKCGKSITDITCNQQCEQLLECGHKCALTCSEPCSECKCMNRCKKKLECGHPCQARCSQPCTPTSVCLFPCEKMLKCNHKCVKKCYQRCTESCLETCEKEQKCGHKCTNACSDNCILVCESTCGKRLNCGHRCRELCRNTCPEVCERRCKKKLQCGHRCSKMCSKPCDIFCKSECGKLLECGHECQELCTQPCATTCEKLCKKTLECGHVCNNKCGDPCTLPSECTKPCERILPCKHTKCDNLCNEPCTECTEKCIKKLDCGHICINKCYEKCACCIVKSTDCLHYVRGKCGETPTKLNCVQQCNKVMECGHTCKQQCNEECKCFESCRKRLKCGCLCIKISCSEPCECRNRCLGNDSE